jgi:hypothetical protein
MRVQLIVTGLLFSGGIVTAQESAREEDVKLALVYNITRFVSWPNDDASTDFCLCVTGTELAVRASNGLRGRKVRERTLTVSDFSPGDSAQICDALYIAGIDERALDDLLAVVAQQPVLTISDATNFATRGGMVGLKRRANRIGMEINVAAYERAGLSVSSQLLQLAENINDGQKAQQ